jgi:hypothetical protein
MLCGETGFLKTIDVANAASDFSVGWFTEGFDTLDLKEAKTLLDELRA